jgi:hypothetical protein
MSDTPRPKHTRTRWYFTTTGKDGYAIDGYVEFDRDPKGQQRAFVYDLRGALKFSGPTASRASKRTAEIAFSVAHHRGLWTDNNKLVATKTRGKRPKT